MLLADQRIPTPARVQPCSAQALAQDLSALLHRLGLTASISDPSGALLAVAGDPEAFVVTRTASAHHQVEVRLCGHTLHVAMPPSEARRADLDLTPRQHAVVELIAEGMRNREIAARLNISLHTVRRHVEALLRRLNVPTRAAAAALLQQGELPVRVPRARPARASSRVLRARRVA